MAQYLLPGGSVFADPQSGATFLLPGGSVITGIPAQIQPPLLTNAQTFYAATLSATYTITVPLLTNAQTFYGFTLVAGTEPDVVTVYASNAGSTQRARGGRRAALSARDRVSLSGRERAAQAASRRRIN